MSLGEAERVLGAPRDPVSRAYEVDETIHLAEDDTPRGVVLRSIPRGRLPSDPQLRLDGGRPASPPQDTDPGSVRLAEAAWRFAAVVRCRRTPRCTGRGGGK